MAHYALLIGVGFYLDAPQLASPQQDVEDWEDVLSGQYQFSKRNITRLTGANDTTREEIWNHCVRFLKKLKDKDFGLLVFSGHGGRFKTGTSKDTKVDTGLRTSDGVLYSEELSMLLKSYLHPTARMVMVIDACNSGKVFTPEEPFRSLIEGNDNNRVLLTASSSVESAFGAKLDGAMRGVFTYHLLQFLRRKGKATFGQFLREIKTHLPDKTNGYHQTPQFFGTPDNLNQSIIV